MLDQREIKITDKGRIGLYYLKKIWQYHQQLKINPAKAEKIEWTYINGVFNALGIGIEPTIKYLMNSNDSFDEFENWIVENGRISRPIIEQFNAIVSGKFSCELRAEEKVFSQSELEQWEKDGYIILRNAIPKVDCEKTINLIYDTIGANNSDPSTWYADHPLKQGIMIQLFNSPILDRNRFSERIRLAYQQLWNRKDLLVSMDRVSFNPPETKFYKFPGPNLHWDVSLKKPIPFGLQGLLYLCDTDENQGAFTVIPGFHKNIEAWLNQLGKDENPRDNNLLNQFNKKPIGAKAGDFIIWNQCLPHGSSPNTSTKPRIVQYINYQPLDMEYQTEWI
ncbi:phytanoyl-CoA dioxygenase family protein [Aequorivita viscosa]|nr:phytanoyl-CoA dioxygenase family protein [Aequorivita viscosa]